MSGSVINQIVAGPPPAGHQISFLRLDHAHAIDLAELHVRAGRLASGLGELGIGRGDRIGILASNCLEWVLLDLAALRLGAVTAGFEPGKFGGLRTIESQQSAPPDQHRGGLRAIGGQQSVPPGQHHDGDDGLIERYGLAVLFTEHEPARCWPRGTTPRNPPLAGHRRLGVQPITAVADLIAGADPARPLPPVTYRPEDVTTIKFTSGSTGLPKGLAATAGSIDSSISAVQQIFGHSRDDNLFAFLPLSLLQQRYWIYSALRYGHDVTISTYETAFAALRRASPTVVMGVPGFYETARKHIESRARLTAGGSGGSSLASTADGGNEAALSTAARALFGDKIRYLWTGSAPARRSTLRFFADVGLPIYEGYGLNETCIVSKNHPGAHREGSVGQVLPGKKVLIDPDGVISVWSEHPVNLRYSYAAPGESERVFMADGTVRTGDLGYLDDDGFLFIQGRADDVIVLDNGKKVIVRPIEEFIKASPAIEECVVLCPAQTYLVAVVSPASQPPDADAITARLAAANANFSQDEQVRDIVIATERFSVANGMLTSQFKPRRKQIAQAYLRQVSATKRKDCDDGDCSDG